MLGKAAELLINLDADGIARIHSAQSDPNSAILDGLFGCREWKERLGRRSDGIRVRAQRILELYKQCLYEQLGAKYVWQFEMRGSRDQLNYFLIFATKHHLGMEKMKEAMRSVDQHGNHSFSDVDDSQIIMFRDDNTESYAARMKERYTDRSVSYAQCRDYALTETPFANPRAILKQLEELDEIEVDCEGRRLKGTFPEDRIKSIRFRCPQQLGLF